jgi:hypothetical protein
MKCKIFQLFAYCCPFLCVPDTWMCKQMLSTILIVQDVQKVSVHLTQCIRTIPTQSMIWRWTSQNTFGMWIALYWTRSSRTQFGVSKTSGDWWRTLWTLLLTFLIVIMRCTGPFWSPCTSQFRFKKQRTINYNIFIYDSERCNTKFFRNICDTRKLIITFIFKY